MIDDMIPFAFLKVTGLEQGSIIFRKTMSMWVGCGHVVLHTSSPGPNGVRWIVNPVLLELQAQLQTGISLSEQND